MEEKFDLEKWAISKAKAQTVQVWQGMITGQDLTERKVDSIKLGFVKALALVEEFINTWDDPDYDIRFLVKDYIKQLRG